MISQPKVEERAEQPYVARRTQATMHELGTVIPQLLGEIFAWLGTQGAAPAGAPFIRYLVINMAAQLDIEVGIPVASTLSGDDRICAGVLPAGRYASLSNLARFAVDRQAIMSAVRLQLLGPPRAWRDEQSLAFKTRKTLALLAYLAAERGLHPRGQLAALLWPDRAEAEARNSLRSALVYLRQALGDADAALAVTRETVGLSLPLPHPRHTGAGPSPAPGPPARDGA